MSLLSTYGALFRERFGNVTRGRGYFLYTSSGVRVTDMYLEKGRAVLGRRAGTSSLILKNMTDRGAFISFDTESLRTVEKAVKTLLPPEYTQIRWFSSEPALSAALENAQTLPVWRPWQSAVTADLPGTPPAAVTADLPGTPPVLLFYPPFPLTSAVIAAFTDGYCGTLPDGCAMTPPYARALARACYDLAAELPLRSEKSWSSCGKILEPYFNRVGPYLFPKMTEDVYERFFIYCLDAEILISPDYRCPSIVPNGAEGSLLKKLQMNPFILEDDNHGAR